MEVIEVMERILQRITIGANLTEEKQKTPEGNVEGEKKHKIVEELKEAIGNDGKAPGMDKVSGETIKMGKTGTERVLEM